MSDGKLYFEIIQAAFNIELGRYFKMVAHKNRAIVANLEPVICRAQAISVEKVPVLRKLFSDKVCP